MATTTVITNRFNRFIFRVLRRPVRELTCNIGREPVPNKPGPGGNLEDDDGRDQHAVEEPAEHLGPGMPHELFQPTPVQVVGLAQLVHQVVQHPGLASHRLAQAGGFEDEVETEQQRDGEERRGDTGVMPDALLDSIADLPDWWEQQERRYAVN